MRSAERILASEDVEEKGLCLAFLKERYTKAALLAFSLDRSVCPYLKGELRRLAKWYWVNDRWSDKARAMTESMICLALVDLEHGGRTTPEERAENIGVSRATWFRHYAKPYESLYSDLVGWSFVGRSHVFRMHNIEELD